MKTATLQRAAALAILVHAPAALAHAGHGAPMIHGHGAAETLAMVAAAILAGAVATWCAMRREARVCR
jgi:hypothetical protein